MMGKKKNDNPRPSCGNGLPDYSRVGINHGTVEAVCGCTAVPVTVPGSGQSSLHARA